MTASFRKTLVFLFALVIIVPLVSISVAVLVSINRGIQKTVLQKNEVIVASVAVMMEQSIQDAGRFLYHTFLGRLPTLEEGQCAILEASLIGSGIFESAFFLDEGGTVRLAVPHDRRYEGFDFSSQPYFSQALGRKNGVPVFSRTFISPITGDPSLVIAFRVTGGVIAGYLNLGWLSKLPAAMVQDRVYLSLVDRYGNVIADQDARLVTQQFSIADTDLFSWAQRERKGTYRHTFLGTEIISSVRFIPGPDWFVIISEPVRHAFATQFQVLFITLVGLLLALVFATITGAFLGRKLLHSISLLEKETRQVQEGTYRQIMHPTPFKELNSFIESFNIMSRKVEEREQQYAAANRALEQSLREKEILLREIHHRVKNNMQIISSLLNLQIDSLVAPEDAALIEESTLRIQTMALVHEKIYQSSSLEFISLKNYLTDLLEYLVASHASKMIEVQIEGDDCELDMVRAIPCALAVFEATMNAVKYGVSPGRTGMIRVLLSHQNPSFVIQIRDDGPGFPEDFSPQTKGGLGFTLMKGLMEQLKGQFQWYTDKGAVVEFSFPLSSSP